MGNSLLGVALLTEELTGEARPWQENQRKLVVAAAQPGSHDQSTPTLWIIPHTHWEGAVFKTREEYLEMGLPHILTALHLLRSDPNYRFVLDQVAYVKPFLDRYPEAASEFKKCARENRLQIAGGKDVMPDVNMPSGESWVRQVLYGKGYYKRELGVNVTVGWALDTFGHHAQMPQLLKLAGYKSYWFQRGVPGNSTPSEFLWSGIDGSQIPAFWLPLGYGLFYPCARNLLQFSSYARGVWEALGRYSHWPNRVALAGADVINPQAILPVMVREFEQKIDRPFGIRFGVPTDYESIVDRRVNRPVIHGELNPVFQGVYSSRIELKQSLRNLERILTTAEKLSALNAWLKNSPDDRDLTRAWESVSFNEAHDLISGDMVDKVYQHTLRRYEFSRALGDAMIDHNLDSLASQIDTRASEDHGGIPILVFNSLGWPRTDIASAKIGFSAPGVTSIQLFDPSGREVPVQLMETTHYHEGGIEDTRIAFIARDVPALGYSVYEAAPGSGGAAGTPSGAKTDDGQSPPIPRLQPVSTMHEDTGSIENEFYRVTFDLWTGAMTRVLVKSNTGNWEALSNQPANIVAEEQDGGDFWELYGSLNGGRLTAMTRKQGLPIPNRSHFSNEWVGGNGAIESGPVFSQFHVSHPFGAGNFSTTVRLYLGIRRIDFETQLVNHDKFVRYRALFPTSIRDGKRFDEIPFGSIERPTEQEFPAQNWIDWSDGGRGVALLNRGLPGNSVAHGALLLSLTRSSEITSYPFVGGYEPGTSSDLGLELGVERTFNYGLVPHSGDWRAARIYQAGLEFNNPLITRVVSSHDGRLPKRWGLTEISPPTVVLSAFKPGADGSAVIRVYEAGGQKVARATVQFQPGVVQASEANLLEEPVRTIRLHANTMTFDLAPYEIKTFKLDLR
ncbi:MAG: alpha-mannosidase [Acidobacteriota bacterium]|nr:alpha-mannosidase [Acidobacteriota bacterium]